MKNHINNELIEYIKGHLQHHEEPYELGAWEAFQATKRKKINSSTDSFAMAVSFCILLLISFAPFTIHDNNFIQQYSLPKLAHDAELVSHKTQHPNTTNQKEVVALPAPFTAVTRPKRILNFSIHQEDYATIFRKKFQLKVQSDGRATSLDLVELLPSIDKGKATKKNSWNIMILLSPTFSSSDVSKTNLGGGFMVNVALFKNISIGSGVAINNYSISKNISEVPSSKSMITLGATFTTLDIPLGLTWALNNKFYMSTGLSSVVLMRQQLSYTFREEYQITTVSIGDDGQTVPMVHTVTQNETETANERAFSQLNLLGFYNISVGYTYTLNNNRQLIFEPFIKIPASQITKEQINFTASGINLKLKF